MATCHGVYGQAKTGYALQEKMKRVRHKLLTIGFVGRFFGATNASGAIEECVCLKVALHHALGTRIAKKEGLF